MGRWKDGKERERVVLLSQGESLSRKGNRLVCVASDPYELIEKSAIKSLYGNPHVYAPLSRGVYAFLRRESKSFKSETNYLYRAVPKLNVPVSW